MGKEKGTIEIDKAVEDFGGTLRDYRLRHLLSLQDVSEIMEYSASYIWRIENHQRFPELNTKLKMLLSIWSTEDVHAYLQAILTKENRAK